MPPVNRAQQRRRQLILILGVAVLLVGGALAWFLMAPEASPPRERPLGKVAMPVVKNEIPRGRPVTLANLDISYVDPMRVPTDAVIDVDVFRNRVAMRTLRRGEYIRAEDLGEVLAPEGYSGVIPPGKRVVVVPTDQITGTMSYLQVGDVVDIISVSAAQSQGGATPGQQRGQLPSFAVSNSGQPGKASTAQRMRAFGMSGMPGQQPLPFPSSANLIVEGAQVLDVPRPNPRDNRINLDNVVLAVDIEEAHRLHLAQASGQTLRLTWRPFNEPPGTSPAVVNLKGDPRLIEVIAGLRRTTQQTIR